MEKVLKLSGSLSSLNSMKGYVSGSLIPGESSYAIAVKNGFVGTEEEWLESLKGEKGDTGEKGETGDSVDVNVVKETTTEYVVEFVTPSKRIESPNLKGDVIEYYIPATNSDIEDIFN